MLDPKNRTDTSQKHNEALTPGQRIADRTAAVIGSWKFIIIQTIFVLAWVALNLVGYFKEWDPYPFILLNLLFSTQAAYAAPIIMMSQNRQNERDRHRTEADYKTDLKSKSGIEEIQKNLCRLEREKIDQIIRILQSK